MKYFRKLAHALWLCKYQVGWCRKYRYHILQAEVGKTVRDIIRRLCEWKKIKILAGNIQIDHIHWLLEIPFKYSVSEAIAFIKDKSIIKIIGFRFELKRPCRDRPF